MLGAGLFAHMGQELLKGEQMAHQAAFRTGNTAPTRQHCLLHPLSV